MRHPILRFGRLKKILIIIILILVSYFFISYILINYNSISSKPYKVDEEALFLELYDEEKLKLQVDAIDKPEVILKIDWQNYNYLKYDQSRTGVGEKGQPAFLDKSEHKLEERLYELNGFNAALSDKISVNRSLPDIRHPLCKSKKYFSKLPTVSVVVPVHNEHWSTLLRTVYSVINRSPASLLKEIILVDDASTKAFLGTKLEKFLKKNVPKARIIRLEKRSGLIAARLKGARAARGDVLVFLDSHIEANTNWLPPLLEPITENYRTAVCPFIDVIAYDTFEYRAQDEGARGAFDWHFDYKRLPLLPSDLVNMPDPFASPIMAGGLFAISQDFFWQLGGYDEGLDIWGGEQYELSFKIWQCGGRLLDTPCSRVGHIYRKTAPFPNPGRGDFLSKNYRRVADVWMDEYAEHLYEVNPHYRNINPGDLTKQRLVRTKLKCKSFKWFMNMIAFDLMNKYPPSEPPPFAEGKIRSDTKPNLCIDTKGNGEAQKIYLSDCKQGTETEFLLSWHRDIRTKSRAMCLDVPESKPGSPIVLYPCHNGGGNQLWRYHKGTKELKSSKSENCLDYDPETYDVFIHMCSDTETQRWIIDTVNTEVLAKWEDFVDQVVEPVEYVAQ